MALPRALARKSVFCEGTLLALSERFSKTLGLEISSSLALLSAISIACRSLFPVRVFQRRVGGRLTINGGGAVDDVSLGSSGLGALA